MKYIIFILLMLTAVRLSAQSAKIDSLKKVIATTKVDTVKGRSMCLLCFILRNSDNLKETLLMGQDGLKILEKAQDQKGIASCLNSLGAIYYGLGEIGKALAYYEKNLALNIKLKSQSGIADAYNNIGMVHELKNDYAKALDYYLRSLKINEQIGVREKSLYTLLNIGNVYLNQQKYDDALKYYQKTLKSNHKYNNARIQIYCMNNIGLIYGAKGEFEKALQEYAELGKLCISNGNKEVLGNCYQNTGNIYFSQQNYLPAFDQFSKAMTTFQELDNKEGVLLSMLSLASIDVRLNRAAMAKQKLQQCFELEKNISSLKYKSHLYNQLFKADSALGDYKSAFEHHKLFKQYSDSLHNEDKAKEFGRIESRYQFEKEAEEAKRKHAEAKRKEQLETERSNNLQYLSIFGGLLFLFGILMVVGRFKIPARVLDVALFAGLLLLFEFLLILCDPILDDFTGGIPIQKLAFNSLIALGFAPLHRFLENLMRKRFGERES